MRRRLRQLGAICLNIVGMLTNCTTGQHGEDQSDAKTDVVVSILPRAGRCLRSANTVSANDISMGADDAVCTGYLLDTSMEVTVFGFS